MVKNFLKAAAAIGVSLLFVFATTSKEVHTNQHVKAIAELFTPVK